MEFTFKALHFNTTLESNVYLNNMVFESLQDVRQYNKNENNILNRKKWQFRKCF